MAPARLAQKVFSGWCCLFNGEPAAEETVSVAVFFHLHRNATSREEWQAMKP